MMTPPDSKLSSEMLWQGALVFALVDLSIVLFLVGRIKPSGFRQLAWAVAVAAAIFWSALWASVLRLFWEPFYKYVFPDWALSLAPSFGLAYACVGLMMWWFALRLSGNAVLSFCLLGGGEGLISHLWAIYSLEIIEKVPMLEGVSPASVLVFAVFEKILYWSIILGIAALLYRIWRGVQLFYWVNHPENKWLNWVMGTAFFIVLLLPALGLLLGRPSSTTLLTAATTVSPTSEMPPGIREDEGWIEVDLARQKARIRQGRHILAEYLAAAGVGDSPETTTYTGLFRVQYKEKGPVESVPGVYVTDVVMFDYTHGNAFHSKPVDKEGRVLDERLGLAITAGCVRISESAALFDFAKLDMKVWVH